MFFDSLKNTSLGLQPRDICAHVQNLREKFKNGTCVCKLFAGGANIENGSSLKVVSLLASCGKLKTVEYYVICL